jgi:hypothetical protein
MKGLICLPARQRHSNNRCSWRPGPVPCGPLPLCIANRRPRSTVEPLFTRIESSAARQGSRRLPVACPCSRTGCADRGRSRACARSNRRSILEAGARSHCDVAILHSLKEIQLRAMIWMLVLIVGGFLSVTGGYFCERVKEVKELFSCSPVW